MDDNCVIVTVVRDFDMYRRCVECNPNTNGTSLESYDNRQKNENITVLYNRFLQTYDYAAPAWFVFCHEDFAFLEPIKEKLCDVGRNAIYGPVGGVLSPRHRWLFGGLWPGKVRGRITDSEKDGSRRRSVGEECPSGTVVETLDCSCIIVHSDLVKQYVLRFDERLSFDLYAEDLCLGAYINHGIPTKVLTTQCHHYSRGRLLPRFFKQRDYLCAKYPLAEAYSVVGYAIGGGRTPFRRFQKRVRNAMDRKCPWLVEMILNQWVKLMK